MLCLLLIAEEIGCFNNCWEIHVRRTALMRYSKEITLAFKLQQFVPNIASTMFHRLQ